MDQRHISSLPPSGVTQPPVSNLSFPPTSFSSSLLLPHLFSHFHRSKDSGNSGMEKGSSGRGDCKEQAGTEPDPEAWKDRYGRRQWTEDIELAKDSTML